MTSAAQIWQRYEGPTWCVAPPFGVLFLNNNYHAVHHDDPALNSPLYGSVAKW